MKLSECLGWPKKTTSTSLENEAFCLLNNSILTACDREIDREALLAIIFLEAGWKTGFHTEALADKIISTIPTWLKRIESK